MGFIKEFKTFALKGNLIDMAIAFVMGASFTAVTKSFIEGIFMPLVGLVVQVDNLSTHVLHIGKSTVLVGAFAGAIINFLILAFVMFMIIKGMNKLKKKEEVAPTEPPVPTKEEILLTEIRDLLKK